MTASALTFAAIKRRAAVGARLELISHADPKVAVLLPMSRTVLRVQSNAIVMSPWPGRSQPSWLHWGKASDIRIDGPDTFTVLEDGVPQLTYRFV